jgi:hypothetical protein
MSTKGQKLVQKEKEMVSRLNIEQEKKTGK